MKRFLIWTLGALLLPLVLAGGLASADDWRDEQIRRMGEELSRVIRGLGKKLPLNWDGMPRHRWHCGGCPGTCYHHCIEVKITEEFRYKMPWYDTLVCQVEDPRWAWWEINRWSEPHLENISPRDALKRGTVTRWERMIYFRYGEAVCGCADPIVRGLRDESGDLYYPQCRGNACKGSYPLAGQVVVRLKRPITEEDLPRTWRYGGPGAAPEMDGEAGRSEWDAGSSGYTVYPPDFAGWPTDTELGDFWEVDYPSVETQEAIHKKIKEKLLLIYPNSWVDWRDCICCKAPAADAEPETPKKKFGWLVPSGLVGEGLFCMFIPSGRNYGDIGDLLITNPTDEPVTCVVPDGMLLDSSDPITQDLYVANVPTETPCSGAELIGRPVTVGAGESYLMRDLPGYCPDFELAPPDEGVCDIYTPCAPDERGARLLEVIAAVQGFDVGPVKLDLFEEGKAREMMCQGALWTVESAFDDVEGNEVTAEQLAGRYWEAFETSAGAALEAMPSDQRQETEELVRDEIRRIVSATSFVAKGHM